LAGATLNEQTSQFGERDAESEGAFHMLAGLFKLLSAAVRTRVLAAREPLSNGTTNPWLDYSKVWNWGLPDIAVKPRP
jgi:hypothetical protein